MEVMVVRPIAINLAQFHEMELNNKWWGKGFTDWDKVSSAEPLYEGHFQPKIPLNGYYDMSKKETLEFQTDLMNKYSIYGMAYYHYWYNDGPLMDTPLKLLHNSKDINQRFMLYWSNCDWYYSEPDSYRRKMILRQEYGNQHEWKIHIDYLIDYFKDDRYITCGDKPVLIVYRPGEIPCFDEMILFFESECIKAGLKGIYIIETMFNYGEVPYSDKSDAVIYREPNCSKKYAHKLVKHPSSGLEKDGSVPSELDVFQYDEIVGISLKKQFEYDYKRKLYYSVFTSWDNTARHRYKGFVIENSTPLSFGNYLKEIDNRLDNAEDFVFINAWNEWAEGMYLEPDINNKDAYLSMINCVVKGIELVDNNTSNNYYKYLNSIINNSKKVFIYGAGVYGKEAKKYIDQYCCSNVLYGFIDDTESKINKMYLGLPVLSIKEFANNHLDALVLVCCDERSHHIMIHNLRNIGLSENLIMIPQIAFLDPEEDIKFIKNNFENLKILSGLLSDDKSKQVLYNVMSYKVSHNQILLDMISDNVDFRYYDDSILQGRGKGILLDCGSYIGDSLDGYVKYASDYYKGAICCEAIPNNIKLLTEHLEQKAYINVEVIDQAIWKTEGSVYFDCAGVKSGFVSDSGNIQILSTTIDKVAFGRQIDFIKIEINGAEFDALLGATNTIVEKKPVIAVSVYHNPLDIIRIPLLIYSLNTDYSLFLRFYGHTTLTDIVCYAIPKNDSCVKDNDESF